jgi:hypothetical protein
MSSSIVYTISIGGERKKCDMVMVVAVAAGATEEEVS